MEGSYLIERVRLVLTLELESPYDVQDDHPMMALGSDVRELSILGNVRIGSFHQLAEMFKLRFNHSRTSLKVKHIPKQKATA